jgi:hypothetical protein
MGNEVQIKLVLIDYVATAIARKINIFCGHKYEKCVFYLAVPEVSYIRVVKERLRVPLS